MRLPAVVGVVLCATVAVSSFGFQPPAALTTLSNPAISYRRPEKSYVILRRGDVEAVIADNRAVDDEVLPRHRAGYSGVASLKHARRQDNLFVPFYSGLNFEHIHDGTRLDRATLFEPRNWPMELRAIDDHTVELYQSATPHFGLESCLRYALLDDGTIEMTLECIPRRRDFANGYVGLFFASYIDSPESLDIHFLGHAADGPPSARWIRGTTPAHGVLCTHLAGDDRRTFAHDVNFPLTLVFNESRYRYAEPWYYGLSHGMALVLMFRPPDKVRFSQSPSGGGRGNPAWDFQYLIPDYEVGRCYQTVVRAMYLPYESPEQVEQTSRPHRQALGSR